MSVRATRVPAERRPAPYKSYTIGVSKASLAGEVDSPDKSLCDGSRRNTFMTTPNVLNVVSGVN